MHHRLLGNTGLRVSSLALGTVSLGRDYGIEAPGEFGRPFDADAVQVLRDAADSGINLYDVAPGYGESERLLGQALGACADCYFATKVAVPLDGHGRPLRGAAVRQEVDLSLERSAQALARDCLDIVQITTATVEVIEQGEVTAALVRARERGALRFIGASVYGVPAALAVVESGAFDMVQVAYSVLDQRMAAQVFPRAAAAGVGILVRSALLKGALTAKAAWLPPSLEPLRQAAERAKDLLAGSWPALPATALRFCLSAPEVSSVLVGVRTRDELREALAAEAAGPLDERILEQAATLALSEEHLVNPTRWPIA